MTKVQFSTGGFALHGISDGLSKVSAWYDKNGVLLDWERIDRRNRSTTIIRESLKNRLRSLGRIEK